MRKMYMKNILIIIFTFHSFLTYSQFERIDIEREIIEKKYKKKEYIKINEQEYNLCEVSIKKYYENKKLNSNITFGWMYYGIKNDYLAFHKFIWNEKNYPEKVIRITQIDTLDTKAGIFETEEWKYENDSILTNYQFKSEINNLEEKIINKWSSKKDTLYSLYYNYENILIKEKKCIFSNSKKIEENLIEYLPKESRKIISENKFTYDINGKLLRESLVNKEIVFYETRFLKNDTIIEKQINEFEFDTINNLTKKHTYQKIGNQIYEDETITFENKYDKLKNLIETKRFQNGKFLGKVIYKYDGKLKTESLYYDTENQLVCFDYRTYNEELLESEKYTYFLRK